MRCCRWVLLYVRFQGTKVRTPLSDEDHLVSLHLGKLTNAELLGYAVKDERARCQIPGRSVTSTYSACIWLLRGSICAPRFAGHLIDCQPARADPLELH